MKVIEYISYIMMPMLIVIIIAFGEKKKIPVYECFISGASESFRIIVKIFPSMLAIVVAINVFKVSGMMEILTKLISPLAGILSVPPEAVPIGVMRSISGGGVIAVLTDILKDSGPDSLLGRIASTVMGSSDTTLYVLAIYTSSIAIRKTKNALAIGLICDAVAFLTAVWIWKIFW